MRRENADDLDLKLAKLINPPLTALQLGRMFESRKPVVVAKMQEVLAAGQELIPEARRGDAEAALAAEAGRPAFREALEIVAGG